MEGHVGVACKSRQWHCHCTAGPLCKKERWAEHVARSGILEAHNELHGHEKLQHVLTVIQPCYIFLT